MSQYIRPLYGVFCLVSALLFPYWVTFFVAAVGYVLFDWYIEGVLAVVLTDILFGVPLMRFHQILLVGTLINIILFILIELGKRFTRYGSV